MNTNRSVAFPPGNHTVEKLPIDLRSDKEKWQSQASFHQDAIEACKK